MEAKTRQVLERIIEKADKLANSRFVQQLKEDGNKIVFKKDITEIYRPDDEAIDAFILTYRFFTMDNEKTSFRSIAKNIDSMDVSQKWKDSFTSARTNLNLYLDTMYGIFVIHGIENKISNRDLVDIFLYGGLAHANQPKMVERFELLRNTPMFDLLQIIFIGVLGNVLQYIKYIAHISKLELENASKLEE